MEKLLDEIESYWSTRTEGYSEVNHKELAGTQKNAWLKVLTSQFPDKPKEEIRILDIGTGPGFFPVILAEAGYHVDAVDYTEGMLEKAKENAGELCRNIHFQRMDAQKLEFEDNTFDVVISRNLTWNLEHPDVAYREWVRVLKVGGKLLNFDANWYGYLYEEEQRKAYENDRKNVESNSLDDHYLCTDLERMERIALQVPLSKIRRPEWDVKTLREAGLLGTHTDTEIWKTVWSEEERLNYQSTPMFMVTGVKPDHFLNLPVVEGEKTEGFLEIGDGEFTLPATIIRGKNPGKTVLVTAGLHAGEYVGIQTLIELSKRLKPEKVKGTGTLRQLADLVSIIRFEMGEAEGLQPFADKVNYNFQQWTFRRNAGAVHFTPEQMEWLQLVKDHIATSLSIQPDDLDLSPFDRKGGLGRFYEVFGEEYEAILMEMNRKLVA